MENQTLLELRKQALTCTEKENTRLGNTVIDNKVSCFKINVFFFIVCHIEILFIFDTAEFSQRENFVKAVGVANLVISFGWSLTTDEDQSSFSNKLPQM